MGTPNTHGTGAASGSESDADAAESAIPGWSEPVGLVTSTLVTVAWEARKDLSDRRARWGLAAGCGALAAGQAAAVFWFMRQRAAASGEPEAPPKTPEEVAALRADPALRARTIRKVAVAGGYVLSYELCRLMLPPALRRRGVRRPHLLTGLTLAASRLVVRGAGTIVKGRTAARQPTDPA